VQDELERRSAGIEVIDVVLGPIDEWLAVKLLTGWRRRVWDGRADSWMCDPLPAGEWWCWSDAAPTALGGCRSSVTRSAVLPIAVL
jgi:hypothetical protein